MSDVIRDQVRQVVRKQYSLAAESESCCSGPSCCGTSSPDAVSQALGYSADETAAVPAGANLGLGCGNPQAIADLKPGETRARPRQRRAASTVSSRPGRWATAAA